MRNVWLGAVLSLVVLTAARAAHADSDGSCDVGKVTVDQTAQLCCYPGEVYHPEAKSEGSPFPCRGEPTCPPGWWLERTERYGGILSTCTKIGSANPYADPNADPYVDPYATPYVAPALPARMGRIPHFEVAGVVAVAYGVDNEDDPDETDGFGGGAQLDFHLEPKKQALITLGGFIAAGDIPWGLRANLLFGKKLGWKSSHDIFMSSSTSTTSGNVTTTTTTTTTYLGRKVPIYYGLMLGTSVIQTSGGTAAMIEVGGAAISPQMHFIVAPALNVAGGNLGFRFAFGYAPGAISRLPIFFRFNGDLGGGDAFSNLFTISLGLGSSVGI